MKYYPLSALFLFAFLIAGCQSTYKTAMGKFNLGQYEAAIPVFKKALQETKHTHQQGKIHFYIAESYRLSNRMEAALPFYETSLNDEKFYDDNSEFYYGMALKANGKYEEAADVFEKYLVRGTDIIYRKRARTEVENMEMIKALAKENPYISLTNCDALNTENAEFSPVFFEGKLVFTSNRGSNKIYEATGTGFTDLYYYELAPEDSCQGKVVPLSNEINMEGFHEASTTFSPDGKTMIFARSNSGRKKETQREVDLFICTREGNGWSVPERLPVSSSGHWDGSPAFSADGNTLYFASNRPGGLGGLDIYRCTRNSRGQWAKATNMGNSINTPGNEMFPFISEDRKLYFASDGHPGLGGLDLFVAVNRAGQKIQVSNLGKPYNSPNDDFAIAFRDQKSGYFSSNRSSDGAKGDDDIYFFSDNTPETRKIDYYLAGVAYVNESTGRKILPQVELKLIDEEGNLLDTQASNEEGYFRFTPKLFLGPNYKIIGLKKEYIEHSQIFASAGRELSPAEITPEMTEYVFETDVILTKDIFEELETSGEIVLENILYDFDKADIRPDAALELDKLVAFLNSKPDIRVELGSHTDDRGAKGYNRRLSQQRAESAVNYIVSKGISVDRIQAKGYGEDDLLIQNAQTEEEHQLNRRTTVKLLQ